ncbi:MAG: extracellular solute-binding protein [Victivallaceae bacterium]|nr:extracellular solute-binding protein [Victivallaceae bacterium]
MTKKIFGVTLCLTVLGIFLSPQLKAGKIVQKNGKTTIYVKSMMLPDPSKTDTASRADVEVVKAFVKKFPAIFAKKYRALYKTDPKKYGKYDWNNVEIQMERFSGIKVEGVENDLLAIAGGMAPDILYINFRKSDNYIRNGFIYPLDQYYNKLTPKQREWLINPKILPVVYRKGPDGKKHYWTVPYGGALGKVLLYRKDLFDANNIPYPTKNWTWEDLYNASKKLTDPAKGVYGIRFGQGKHESWFWITFLWSAGGDVMTYDEPTDTWTCTYGSDAGVKALDFYIRLNQEKWVDENNKVRRGYSYKDASQAGVKWDRGEIGMQFAYIEENLMSKMDPETVGLCPVPKGPGGNRGAELNSRMQGLFSEIKDVAVRDAAWEFLLYFSSKEAQEIRTKVMVEGGFGRFINPKYLKMFGYDDIIKLTPKGWAEAFKISIDTGKPEPYGKNSNFAYELMTKPLQEAQELERKDQLPREKLADGQPKPYKLGEMSKERYEILKNILYASNDRAKEIMIGTITPQEKTKRRVLAILGLAMIGLGFFFVFRKIFRIFTPPEADGSKGASWAFKKHKWAYIILIPAALSIFTWRYIPLARGSYMAFFDYKILGNSIFVGVDNFGNLLVDSVWWRSVYDALRYSFLTMCMTFLPPIILAIFLQEVPKGKIFFRTVFYLPAVITGLVTMVLWKQFYEPSETGMLNKLILNVPAIGFIAIGLALLLICLAFANRLRFYEMWLASAFFVLAGLMLFVTIASLANPILFQANETFMESMKLMGGRMFAFTPEPYRWLQDKNTAMLSCIMPMVWAGMGPGCLIYLAALKGIPEDYYEAADLDGATFIDKILFVVFPTLKALVIINFVGVFIGSWIRSTGMILVMTGGGANTETAGLHIWYKAFTYLQFGPATAMAWTLGFMLIGFTAYQLQILSKVEFKTTGKK